MCMGVGERVLNKGVCRVIWTRRSQFLLRYGFRADAGTRIKLWLSRSTAGLDIAHSAWLRLTEMVIGGIDERMRGIQHVDYRVEHSNKG